MGTARSNLSGRKGQRCRGPWKEKRVSPKWQTGGYKRSEKEDTPEAEAAPRTWVPQMLPASGQHRAVLGAGTTLSG